MAFHERHLRTAFETMNSALSTPPNAVAAAAAFVMRRGALAATSWQKRLLNIAPLRKVMDGAMEDASFSSCVTSEVDSTPTFLQSFKD